MWPEVVFYHQSGVLGHLCGAEILAVVFSLKRVTFQFWPVIFIKKGDFSNIFYFFCKEMHKMPPHVSIFWKKSPNFKLSNYFQKLIKFFYKFLENFNLTVNIFRKLMHKNAIKIHGRVIFQRFLKNVWCFLPKKWCFFRFLGGVLGWCFWALRWCFGPMMFWPHWRQAINLPRFKAQILIG